ncbi:MAG: hypothetical protein KF823_01465 [Xanthomonadales bacterium]|nr:hypothetical protein [Xanthomonadales bacterium]
MSPEDIERVRSSFAVLQGGSGDTAALFYRHLFDLAPQARPLFPEDMEAQGEKLMSMLAAIVSALDRPDELHALFADMGRRHVGYGAQESHYDAVGAALLRSLHDALGPAWSPGVEDAWAQVYGAMAEAMIEGASRTAGAPAPERH